MSPLGVSGSAMRVRARNPHARRNRERGSATTEFAVIMPLLVFVVFGTIELGRLVVSRAMLSYASIQGARTAAVTGTANLSDVQNTVISAAPMLGLTSSNIQVQVNGTTSTAASFPTRANGATVTVTVTYTFTPAISIPVALTTKTMTETNTATVGTL